VHTVMAGAKLGDRPMAPDGVPKLNNMGLPQPSQ